jgi:hypothetical protein
MSHSGTKRAPKMVTIHSLDEMKTAARENDPQTKLLVLGLGEAIVTTAVRPERFWETIAYSEIHARALPKTFAHPR